MNLNLKIMSQNENLCFEIKRLENIDQKDHNIKKQMEHLEQCAIRIVESTVFCS